jgi:chromosome segregation ATPase
MSNDLVFLNNYVEVVNDNVSSIIKQNFVFQTQLKMAETKLAQLEDSKQTVDKLSIENKQLNQQLTELKNLTSSYKNVSDDKNRLQVSLNETSQFKNQLQSQINDMQQELTRLRAQSEELETLRKENVALKKKYEPEEKTSVKKLEKVSTKPATAGTF